MPVLIITYKAFECNRNTHYIHVMEHPKFMHGMHLIETETAIDEAWRS